MAALAKVQAAKVSAVQTGFCLPHGQIGSGFQTVRWRKWLRCELERVAEPARTLDTDQILVPAMNPTHLSIPVYECGVQAGLPFPGRKLYRQNAGLKMNILGFQSRLPHSAST